MPTTLNLYCILADESLFHPHFFDGVVQYAAAKKYDVVGVTTAKDKHKKGLLTAVKKQMELWGVVGFSFLVFNTLLRTLLFKLGLDSKRTIAGICKAHGIPLVESFNVNDLEHLEYLRSLNIDIIISSNGHIFKKELLELPKLACINRHGSLLPEYGGVLPVFWAMFYHEKKFGVTVHYMVEKIDQGDLLYQQAIPLDPKNSMFHNYILLFDASILVTTRAIENVLAKKTVGKYAHSDKAYFSFPKPADIAQFKKESATFKLGDIVEYYRVLG